MLFSRYMNQSCKYFETYRSSWRSILRTLLRRPVPKRSFEYTGENSMPVGITKYRRYKRIIRIRDGNGHTTEGMQYPVHFRQSLSRFLRRRPRDD